MRRHLRRVLFAVLPLSSACFGEAPELDTGDDSSTSTDGSTFGAAVSSATSIDATDDTTTRSGESDEGSESVSTDTSESTGSIDVGTRPVNVGIGVEKNVPVAQDWDGDGLADVGLFQPDHGLFVLGSTRGASFSFEFGNTTSDAPVAGRWSGR